MELFYIISQTLWGKTLHQAPMFVQNQIYCPLTNWLAAFRILEENSALPGQGEIGCWTPYIMDPHDNSHSPSLSGLNRQFSRLPLSCPSTCNYCSTLKLLSYLFSISTITMPARGQLCFTWLMGHFCLLSSCLQIALGVIFPSQSTGQESLFLKVLQWPHCWGTWQGL